jgi:D-amino-acid dehydrogenase
VIGAGAAGLATAWELLGQGCKVDVFEANSGIAEGASFASTGFLGAAALVAWDLAGLPPVRPGATASLLPPAWARSVPGMVFWRQRLSQQTTDRQNALFNAAHALAELNAQRIESHLHDSLQEVESTQGAVIAWRTEEQRRLLQAGVERLRQTESPIRELDPLQARALDTAVNPELPFAGAIALPSDRVINGRQWLAHLKNDILQLGGQVHVKARVSGLTTDGVVHMAPVDAEAPKAKTFDAIVVCAASASTGLLKPLGLELPMLVLNHCALSAPVREATHAPSTVWIDAQERIIISRTGQRLRASGGVLVPGTAPQATFKTLYRAVEDWFPGAATLHGDKALVQTWQASVGHTPDGLPLVGRTAQPRIWVNAAHGGRGWTFAAGAAKLLAELMTGQATSLDPASFAPQRPMRA